LYNIVKSNNFIFDNLEKVPIRRTARSITKKA